MSREDMLATWAMWNLEEALSNISTILQGIKGAGLILLCLIGL